MRRRSSSFRSTQQEAVEEEEEEGDEEEGVDESKRFRSKHDDRGRISGSRSSVLRVGRISVIISTVQITPSFSFRHRFLPLSMTSK